MRAGNRFRRSSFSLAARFFFSGKIGPVACFGALLFAREPRFYSSLSSEKSSVSRALASYARQSRIENLNQLTLEQRRTRLGSAIVAAGEDVLPATALRIGLCISLLKAGAVRVRGPILDRECRGALARVGRRWRSDGRGCRAGVGSWIVKKERKGVLQNFFFPGWLACFFREAFNFLLLRCCFLSLSLSLSPLPLLLLRLLSRSTGP